MVTRGTDVPFTFHLNVIVTVLSCKDMERSEHYGVKAKNTIFPWSLHWTCKI